MRGSELHDYFRLNMSKTVATIRSNLLSGAMKLTGRRSVLKVANRVHPHEVMQSLTNNVAYRGFFQSELYFKEYAREVVECFDILPVHKRRFEAKYGAVFDHTRTIAIHVRRTDFHDFALDGKGSAVLPFAYFRRCLGSIENLEDHQIIFVSDEMDVVRREFNNLKNAMFESNDEIVDFQIIQNADVAIISNSSFSWWASYLNQKEPPIFAPKDWLGFRCQQEYPTGVMLDRWHDVDALRL